METIISAVISAGAAIVVCIINQNRQALKLEAQLDKYVALTNQKIDTLSDRVDRHNNIIERTYALERDVAVIRQELEDDAK